MRPTVPARLYMPTAVIATLLCVACSPERSSDAHASSVPEECSTTPLLCDATASYEVRCGNAGFERSQAQAECRERTGDFEERLDPCFVRAYADCLDAAACGELDACFGKAVAVVDPTSVDSDALAACDAGEESACDRVTSGVLRECLDRAMECSTWDDPCTNLIILQEPYRSRAESCLAGPCEQLADCLSDAGGAPAR